MSWLKDLQVWIPAQGVSTRIKNKNTRPFCNGLSLLQIKINQILKVVDGSKVIVSSDSEDALKQARDLGCQTVIRDSSLTGNSIRQKDLFEHFFENTEVSKYILWCQVTDPLFDDFSGFLSTPPNVGQARVLVSELRKHAFYMDQPLNFQFGLWHKVTQDIEPVIIPRWSCFLHDYNSLKECKYHFGIDNDFYVTDNPLIDIDTHHDFENAKVLFSQMHKDM